MKVRYTYRLRPGRTARRYLAREWGMCRYVWNELVAQSNAVFEARHTIALAGAEPVTFGAAQADRFLTRLRANTTDQDGVKWLAAGASVAQQQTVRDFAGSRAKALADIMNKKPTVRHAGMPRFKRKADSLPTLNYTNRGFRVKPDATGVDRLVLPGGVGIPVVWSRDLPSVPSSVRVSQDSLGHWYASFVVEIPEPAAVPARTNLALGIDWGVTETATTARVDLGTGAVDEGTAFDLPHHEHGKRAASEMAAAQRKMVRRSKPSGQAESHGYRLAKHQAAKVQKKLARQRKDDARKWAKRVVAEHRFIAVENFRPGFLAKTTMARKAADAAIAVAKEELLWQALKAGRTLKLVSPAHTTMDCAHCGARTTHPLPLGQRTYACEACGVTRPRDKNSAAVMVARAGFVPADAEGVIPGPALAPDLVA